MQHTVIMSVTVSVTWLFYIVIEFFEVYRLLEVKRTPVEKAFYRFSP